MLAGTRQVLLVHLRFIKEEASVGRELNRLEPTKLLGGLEQGATSKLMVANSLSLQHLNWEWLKRPWTGVWMQWWVG